MKLVDLEPRWVHPNVFVFLCPHCKGILLSCKNVEMSATDQRRLFEEEFGDTWSDQVITSQGNQAWNISGTRPMDPSAAFPTDLSVNPSLDASASGHWHGHIINGEIVGGVISNAT